MGQGASFTPISNRSVPRAYNKFPRSVGNSMAHGEAPSIPRGRQQDWKELETEDTS